MTSSGALAKGLFLLSPCYKSGGHFRPLAYNKRVYTHLMRHTSATHLVENGTDINLIQKILGHGNVKTTGIYLHISHNLINKISPLGGIRL